MTGVARFRGNSRFELIPLRLEGVDSMAVDAFDTSPLVGTTFPHGVMRGLVAGRANGVGVLCRHVLDAGTRGIVTRHLTFHVLLGSGVARVALVL